MTKLQQIKTFAKFHGLTVKSDRNGVTLNGKITWTGEKHVGYITGFDTVEEAYNFLMDCTANRNFPWKEAA